MANSGNTDERFPWTVFYEAIAEKLLNHQHDRQPLVEGLYKIAENLSPKNLTFIKQDQFPDGTEGPLQDICPFTILAMFNKHEKDESRQSIARELAQFLGVEVEVPKSFKGIPTLHHPESWFFGFAKDRNEDDIETLWKFFAVAIRFVKSDQPQNDREFAQAYDVAIGVKNTNWNLSIGLHWVHPWHFPTLNLKSRRYIKERLNLEVPLMGEKPFDSEKFLRFRNDLKKRFDDDDCPVHSFPELSLEAHQYKNPQDTSSPTEPYSTDEQFRWTVFYEAVAEKLLDFQNNRKPLIEGLHEIAKKVSPHLDILQKDQFPDGTTAPLQDICPFTTLATFNRHKNDETRQRIARELAQELGVDVEVPKSFEGVPILIPLAAWFFGFAKDKKENDIDALWQVFAAASDFVKSDHPQRSSEFERAYNAAIKVQQVSWKKLSIGLYWAHPWHFPTLDSNSCLYLNEHLNEHFGFKEIFVRGDKLTDAKEFLQLRDNLKNRLDDKDCPARSFPELSLKAWQYEPPDTSPPKQIPTPEDSTQEASLPPEPYSVDSILDDGCFHERDEIDKLLERLKSKKNLILQGAPGTGKTWMGRRLAWALMGAKDNTKIRAIQFHPSLSYEDFVRGWRPAGSKGGLELVDGTLMEMIDLAHADPDSKFVVLIEEINRGNPAQIFGEFLTLLEATKRKPSEALELAYPKPKADNTKETVHVPKNLYVIGTMNIADRSLALIDFAFRRRFAFATLEPKLNKLWRDWMLEKCKVPKKLVDIIEKRIGDLNQTISGDNQLGTQFQIGHSYVTLDPSESSEQPIDKNWFVRVVEMDIKPLLEEYWFDSPKKAKEESDKLLEGW